MVNHKLNMLQKTFQKRATMLQSIVCHHVKNDLQNKYDDVYIVCLFVYNNRLSNVISDIVVTESVL